MVGTQSTTAFSWLAEITPNRHFPIGDRDRQTVDSVGSHSTTGFLRLESMVANRCQPLPTIHSNHQTPLHHYLPTKSTVYRDLSL